LSVSQQAPPSKVKAVFKKGQYFTSGKSLYYIRDIMPDADTVLYLIENCKTNEPSWWTNQEFSKARKAVVSPRKEG
jgi:hypothetical protein